MAEVSGEDRADRRREVQQRFQSRRKAQLQGLEAQVQSLQQQLQALEVEKVVDTAQLETLTEYVNRDGAFAFPALQPGGHAVQPPRAEGLDDRLSTEHGAVVTVDDEGAADIARLVAAVRGPGESRPGAAECRTITAAFMTDLYEDVRKRIHMLLERDNAEEGTESARGLEVVMTAYANVFAPHKSKVWRSAPPLHWAVIAEVWQRAIAAHGLMRPSDIGKILAAMNLSAEQGEAYLAQSVDMWGHVSAMCAQHRSMLRNVARLPLSAADVKTMQSTAASIVELHQQLREIIEDHCSSVPAVRSIQMARGLVATPYPLCNMLPAMHYLSLQDGPSMSAKLDSLTRIMSWLREPEDSPMDRDSSEGLLAAVDNISEELLEGVDDISDIVAEPPAPDVEAEGPNPSGE